MIALLLVATLQCPDGTPPPCRGVRAAIPSANSVAVLYFENTSRDSADAYLADGLTDEIILRLQQVRRLEVKSRYESQRVRGRRNAAPAVLGRELAARFLVNGTIQRAGERIVVRVELTRADRGVGVWSERYDQTSASVLDVIDDVARGVATGVAGQLLPAEAADLGRRPTMDPVAYAHFVKGNVFLAQRSSVSLARAVEEYEAAYARDPGLKTALARGAYAYGLGLAYGVGDLPSDTVAARADAAVERAMRLAPELSDSWLARGFLQLVQALAHVGDVVDSSAASLVRALTLDPRSAEAHHQYAQVLVILGRDSAAFAEYGRALALEPGRAVTQEEIALLWLMEGRFRDAAAWSDSTLASDPRFVRGYLNRALARLALGDSSGAEQDVARARAFVTGPQQREVENAQAAIHALGGDTAAVVRLALNFRPRPDEVLIASGASSQVLDAIADLPSPAQRCLALRRGLMAALRGQPRFDAMVATCPAPERAQ